MVIINRQLKSSFNAYWEEVNQKTQILITQILSEKLPLALKNLKEDKDYSDLLTGYQKEYEEGSVAVEQVAHEITYEYLLLVIKSLVKTLKEFTCHEAEYMEGLNA